jgi:hypothetical protein
MIGAVSIITYEKMKKYIYVLIYLNLFQYAPQPHGYMNNTKNGYGYQPQQQAHHQGYAPIYGCFQNI